MKKQIALAVLETREEEEMFTNKYIDHQNRYNAAFHAIMYNIVEFSRCGVDLGTTVRMFKEVMDTYQIEEFNPTDWDIICDEFGRRAWETIPKL